MTMDCTVQKDANNMTVTIDDTAAKDGSPVGTSDIREPEDKAAVVQPTTILPFMCSLCFAAFRTIDVFVAHFEIHPNISPDHFHCCGEAEAATISVSMYTCSQCCDVFPSLCMLENHMLEKDNTHFVYDSVQKLAKCLNNISSAVEDMWYSSDDEHQPDNMERLDGPYNDAMIPLNLSRDRKSEVEVKHNIGVGDDSKMSAEPMKDVGAIKKADKDTMKESNGSMSSAVPATLVDTVLNSEGMCTAIPATSVEIVPSSEGNVVDNTMPSIPEAKVERKSGTLEDRDAEIEDTNSKMEAKTRSKNRATIFFTNGKSLPVNLVADTKGSMNQNVLSSEGSDAPVARAVAKRTKAVEKRWQKLTNKDGSLPFHRQVAQCTICGKQVKKGNLPSHLKTHTDERPYSCERCGTRFKSKEYRRQHKKCDPSQSKFHCDSCGKDFKYSQNFKDHLKIHTNDRAFACPHCPMRFTTNHILRAHLTRHSDATPHQCTKCGKSFKRRDGLLTHMDSHIDTKTVVCNICDKRFATERHLKDHRKTHLAVKPHICHICGHGFIERCRLRTHLRVHGIHIAPQKATLNT